METKFHFAKKIINEAADYLRNHLESPLEIECKSGPTDLVTQMDQKIQNLLISRIQSVYANDKILAEENGEHTSIFEGNVWVIDPIDGTNNFIAQKTDFAIMLSYFEEGKGQFGLIYDVMNDQLYHGGGQFDVYCNQEKLHVYQEKPLDVSLIACNAGMLEKNAYGVIDLVQHSLGVRLYGSAALSFARVLSNQLVLYMSYIWPWDYAAAVILGEKLGYALLTIDGEVPDFKNRQAVILFPKSKKDEIQSYLKRGEE